MTNRTAIYVITGGATIVPRSFFMVKKLSGKFDQLYVAMPEYLRNDQKFDRIKRMVDEVIVDGRIKSVTTGLNVAANYLKYDVDVGIDEVWVISSDAYGPLGEIQDAINFVENSKADIIAPYFHNIELDTRLTETQENEKIPYLDFTVFKKQALLSEAFKTHLDTTIRFDDYWQDFSANIVPLFRKMRDQGLLIDYFLDSDILETADPRIWELHKITEHSPVFSQAALFLPPELYDLYAIYGERALESVKRRAPELHKVVWSDLLLDNSLRDIYTKFDELEIIPEKRLNPEKKNWDFGTVAIFIHAFYARMMPEFWELILRIPGDFKLFITTATEENRERIVEFLKDKSLSPELFDVRVVEVNRGRDMSSLFISFKDVILSGDYEVCLRLHSKRTPQVARQVGESFKDHLFENLVYNKDYVENLYDYLEDNPSIGLVIPPVIHIGFGTLGHSWFNNRQGVERLCSDLQLNVVLDEHTPIAPYGTMYWFRAEALKKMFSWPWQFDSYNKEPMHVDGGLAHLQERLIGYACQSAGYRVVAAMNRHSAARNYVKLEYKAQLFAAHMPTANIYEQRDILQKHIDSDRILGMSPKTRRSVYDKIAAFYRKTIVNSVVLHKIFRPIASRLGVLLRQLR